MAAPLAAARPPIYVKTVKTSSAADVGYKTSHMAMHGHGEGM